MNYEEFLKFKSETLLARPNIINLAENNLYKYHPFDLSYDGSGHVNSVVYRCHLVEDWLKYYNLPGNLKKYVGVSNGIRHSLDTLSEKFTNKNFLIPKDVYPFYQRLLNEKRINFKEYQTLAVESLFSNIEHTEADILLITDPIKPLGRDILSEEYDCIDAWLFQDKNRILLVDMAYLLDNKINKRLLSMYHKTQQVIFLCSISKGWSLPNHFGITVFMPNDAGQELREYYKLLDKNQDNLNLAYMALNKAKDYPQLLKVMLKQLQERVEIIIGEKLPQSTENPSYLFYLNKNFEALLSQNILSIPASVFGGDTGVVISSLIK